jgi:hypothetical protein
MMAERFRNQGGQQNLETAMTLAAKNKDLDR